MPLISEVWWFTPWFRPSEVGVYTDKDFFSWSVYVVLKEIFFSVKGWYCLQECLQVLGLPTCKSGRAVGKKLRITLKGFVLFCMCFLVGFCVLCCFCMCFFLLNSVFSAVCRLFSFGLFWNNFVEICAVLDVFSC